MSALTWLNDLMTWLARWVPHIVLIEATTEGVLFGPRGRVIPLRPGVWMYWPIIHRLQIVSTRLRTMELAAQLHGREAVQVVVGYRIARPLTAVTTLNDVAANLDDRTQAALAAGYAPGRDDAEIAAAVLDRLVSEFAPCGVDIETVDVSQRGPVLSLKMLNDWAVHESRSL